MILHSSILAVFISPALAAAGAGAASIPIIIHLLSRRRYREIRWAAMDFLLEAERRNRRRVRIEELILLAMRCLAMLLVGVTLARWFIRPTTMAAVLGTTSHTDRIVLLDDSYSMETRSEGNVAEEMTRKREAGLGAGGSTPGSGSGKRAGAGPVIFDQAKASALRLTKWLAQESPNDSFTIVLTSRPDQPWRQEMAVGHIDLAGLENDLASLSPSSRGAKFPLAFDAVRHMLEGRKGTLSATVYVISDFQQVDWTRSKNGEETRGSAARTAQRSPATALAGWDGNGKTLRILLMDMGRARTANLTVTAIEPQQTQTVATVSGNYTVRVANFGERESDPVQLQVFIGDAAQPAAMVPSVPLGQSVEVPIEAAFPNEGFETLTVELAPDDLAADNTRSCVAPVARALRILVVNGEPSTDPYQDEVFLMNVALRPEGPQFSGNEITVVDENEFEAAELSTYAAVVLANVYRVTEEMASRLEQFVVGGGGVAFWLGDQVDPELYNRILYRDGKGLLPAKLGELATAPEGTVGIPFGEVNIAHPAMRRFRDPQVPYFEGVLTYRYITCEPAGAKSSAPADGSASSAPAPDSSLITAHALNGLTSQPADLGPRSPAQVLLRFEDLARSPALVERTMGAGKVMLATTSVDKEWTNLPERPAYIVLLMEMMQYLAKPAIGGGEQLVGQPIQFALDPAKFLHSAMLRLPSFPEEPAVRIEAQADAQAGAPMLRWERTDQPGLYRFALSETTGGEQVKPVAVNVDPAEGDLRHADRGELMASMTGLPVEYVTGTTITQQADAPARRELWSTLLLVLVTVLMCEQALAWWFGGGRHLASLLPSRKAA